MKLSDNGQKIEIQGRHDGSLNICSDIFDRNHNITKLRTDQRPVSANRDQEVEIRLNCLCRCALLFYHE